MIDIVCVYTKTDLVEQMKQSAVDNGGYADINFVLLDNTAGRFSSAAQAYNYALDNCCKSEVIIFCHQDIVFYENSVATVNALCTQNDNVLYGAAGAVLMHHTDLFWDNSIITNIWQGSVYGTYKSNRVPAGGTCEVFSLDECLIAANRKIFDFVRFDEVTCDNWHMYAVDLSLQCHLKNIPVVVFDANVLHLSGGACSPSFYETVEKVVAKYKTDFKYIAYPCGGSYTNPIISFIYRTHRKYDKVLRFLNPYRAVKYLIKKIKEKRESRQGTCK